jgi:hypothetical protein
MTLHSPDVHFNNIHFVNSANDERLESQKVKKIKYLSAYKPKNDRLGP